MSVISLPSNLYISSMRWSQVRMDFTFSSVFGSQSQEISSPKWAVQLVSDRIGESSSGDWKALLMKLRGQTNQLELHDHARPVPRGTMRGTMTLNTAITQGDVVMSIVAAGEVSKTLVTGDLLGIGTGLTKQVVMVVTGGTSDGSGIISVTVEPPLRNNHLIGASVTWDKPTALFRRQQSESSWDYDSVFASGFSLDLIEDVRP